MSEKLTDDQICDLVVDYMMKSRELDNSPMPSFVSLSLRVAAFKHVRYNDSEDLELLAAATTINYDLAVAVAGRNSQEAASVRDFMSEIMSVVDDPRWMNAIQKENA